ncbi:hypothetical protein ISF_06469 [Cordyceps fumosorosea ARSEF 2679]|uniref:Uncharacterized protein n=1 Tax=Cordyceps fumosorosea (strain ARSEF 2679) TaxID=1081104 RepID=A0A167RKJ2_CORFA|nr:hypothetical protein ISF_06469 [Cordyceps fumosorosea ARSEF 2679]OAA58686.1 hypothetical protein ISF_06469 [Cordyceps fumosorosea ARSEF 2679]
MAKNVFKAFAGGHTEPSGPSTSTGNHTKNVLRIFSPGSDGTPSNSANDKSGVGTAACIAVVGGAIAAAGAAAGYYAGTYASGQDRRQADAPDLAVPMVEIINEELYTSEVKETTTTRADGSTTTEKTSKQSKQRREKRVVRRQPRHAQAEGAPGVPPRAPEAEMRRRMAVALMGQG